MLNVRAKHFNLIERSACHCPMHSNKHARLRQQACVKSRLFGGKPEHPVAIDPNLELSGVGIVRQCAIVRPPTERSRCCLGATGTDTSFEVNTSGSVSRPKCFDTPKCLQTLTQHQSNRTRLQTHVRSRRIAPSSTAICVVIEIIRSTCLCSYAYVF